MMCTGVGKPRARQTGRTVFNTPNALSALRFPLAALFPLAGDGGRIAILAIAAASDWVDGRLARRTGRTTRAGELLDPIADKTFVLAALITLAVDGLLPAWTLPLLLIRDIGVVLGAIVIGATGKRMRMSARGPGKLVTWLQFAGIGAMLLWPQAASWIAIGVAVAGVYALVDYGRAYRTRNP